GAARRDHAPRRALGRGARCAARLRRIAADRPARRAGRPRRVRLPANGRHGPRADRHRHRPAGDRDSARRGRRPAGPRCGRSGVVSAACATSASAAVTLAAGTRLCHLPQPFRLAGGGQLEAPHVALRLSGEPGLPVVAVLGGISADRHVTRPDGRGWWQRFVGPRCAVDSGRYRILSIDWLGGAGESTRATPGFPAIDVADQARALAAVCDALGVASLHAVVGASYGGCVALAFARDHRDRLDRLVVLAAAARARPSAIASRVLQRRIVALGVATGRSGEGLALARALAMTTYRSRRELDARFAAPVVGSSTGYPVVDWLEAQGRRFAARFTADAYLCLSE